MTSRTYIACHQRVNMQHGSTPNSFLDQIVDTIDCLPDEVFKDNSIHDVYSVMLGALGPYTGLLHRRAVMCEVLRVLAGFESDWRWSAGVDVTNHRSMENKAREETGAFQVSWDSMNHDPSLRQCVHRFTGSDDVDTFIKATKDNHEFAVEYCARLLRFSTRWCGTINDAAQVMAHVRRDAVAEFQSCLLPDTVRNVDWATSAIAVLEAADDGSHIVRLCQISEDIRSLDDAQRRAARKLLQYDGEVFPTDACAITLSTLLQDAGILVPDIYQALDLSEYLKRARNWIPVAIGSQRPGDVGSTCLNYYRHGYDHIFVLLQMIDADQMLIADNQSAQPHSRYISGLGKTPTTFFLRAHGVEE